MAKVFDKVNMPIAVKDHSIFNFNSQHITTSNFMEFSVAKAIELVPGQEITIDHNVFTRLEPMPLPTFGVASIHNKAFFVPFRTVMPGWNDFIDDVAHVYGPQDTEHISSVHSIKNSAFVSMLTYPDVSEDITSQQGIENPPAFDFCTITTTAGGATPKAYRFTPFGRRIFKILTSLGYRFNFDLTQAEEYHSALPLLCLIKIYIDWYYPSVYCQDDSFFNLEWLLKEDSTTPFYNNVGQAQLLDIFRSIDRVCYDSDYFVSSWDNPTGPNSNAFSSLTVKDITLTSPSSSEQASTLPNGTAYTPSNRITTYVLSAVKSISDYLKRHQLASARVLDRYLARWGIVLDSAKLNRSIWFGENKTEIKFGDVTSTADTDGEKLGAYAGKGIANGDAHYQFKTDEYGMLIVISTIIPKTSYYQGRNRHTKHLTKLDFYTPEFDNLGVQALAVDEVFSPMDARMQYPKTIRDAGTFTQNPVDSANQVFSFVPRYAEYKVPNDMISGDYLLGSKNAGKDAWTLFRDLNPFFDEDGSKTKHSLLFMEGLDADQYNRIFYNTGNDADHFNVSHLFRISTKFPGKKLYDTYEFDSEGEASTITMDNGGVKAN